MQKLIFRNANGVEVDLTSGDFGITDWKGFSDVSLNLQTQQVPFQDGSVYLDGLLGNREISVTLAVNDNNDLEKRYELRRNLIEILNPKLGEGTLIYRNDYLMRQIKGVPLLPVFKNKNSNDRGTLKASLAWTCPNPYWEDVEEKVVVFGISKQPKINNEGDVPCQVKMNILTFGVNNFSLINQTIRKKIKIVGELTKSLYINTEIGNKKIQQLNFNLNILSSNNNLISSTKKDDVCFIISENGNILRQTDDLDFVGAVPDVVSVNRLIYSEYYDCFYVICNAGKIYKTLDFNTWSLIEIENIDDNYDFNDISIKDNEIVIVGKNNNTGKGFLVESLDSENWNKRDFDSILNSICFNENINKFEAVGKSSGIQGRNQEWVEIQLRSYSYTFIRYIKELNKIYFNYKGDSSSVLFYAYSLSSDFSNNAYIYSGEIKDAVYIGGTLFLPGRGRIENLWYSYDGVSFEKRRIKGDFENDNPKLNTCFFNENSGLYNFIGEQGVFLNSSDLNSWEEILKKNISHYLNGIQIYYNGVGQLISTTYSPEGVFILFNTSTQYYNSASVWKISNDFDVYQICESDNNIRIYNWNRIKFINSIFYAIGKDGKIFKSNDCISWTQCNTPLNTSELTDIIYSKGYSRYYVCGKNGTILESSNGVDFTKTNTGLLISGDFKFIVEAFTYINFIGENNEDNLWIERDLSHWQDMSDSVQISTNNIIEIKNFNSSDINNPFISCIGSSLYSGYYNYNWTRLFLDASVGTINDVCFSETNNIYCAVTEKGFLIISYDMENWGKILQYNSSLKKIEINPITKKFLIFDENGFINQLGFKIDENSNLIQKLSEDSYMGLNLIKGENILRITRDSGNVEVILSYRQKYIGV